jgi:hypothetical protein
MDKGNKDSHRYTYSRGIKAQETQKWGRDTAARRYGEPQSPSMRPKNESFPQFRESQRSDKGFNDVPNDWRRAAGEAGKAKAMSKLPPLREPSRQPDMRPPKMDTGGGRRKAPSHVTQKGWPYSGCQGSDHPNYDRGFKGQKGK